MARALPTQCTQTLVKHEGAVLVARFNSDGNYCLSGGQDRILRLWNPHTGLLVKEYKGHGYEILDIDICSDNSKFVACGGDKPVFLWDVAEAKILRRFRGHSSRVNACKFAADTQVVVTASYDKSIRFWDMRAQTQDPIEVIEFFKDSVSSLVVNAHEIYASSVDGTVRVFDIRAGKVLEDHIMQPVTSIALSADKQCILATCLDSTIRLMDKSSGELLNEYKGHKNSSYKVESIFMHNDAVIASGSEDGHIYYWDLVETRLLHKQPGHKGVVGGLAFSMKDGGVLLSTSVDGTIRIWKAPQRL